MERKVASLTPALTVNGCGCFLPDLTRFTTLQCGETRRRECYHRPLAEFAPDGKFMRDLVRARIRETPKVRMHDAIGVDFRTTNNSLL